MLYVLHLHSNRQALQAISGRFWSVPITVDVEDHSARDHNRIGDKLYIISIAVSYGIRALLMPVGLSPIWRLAGISNPE